LGGVGPGHLVTETGEKASLGGKGVHVASLEVERKGEWPRWLSGEGKAVDVG
jgi:hypothetical protein